MQQIVKYFKDVAAEMKMVTWSTREEVTSATTLVVVFALVMAIVVWGIDKILAAVIGLVL
jgi:preprotein translocase subunit SecE